MCIRDSHEITACLYWLLAPIVHFSCARAPLTHKPPHTLVSVVSIAERTLSAVCNVIAVTAVLAVNRIDVLPLLLWAAAPTTCTPLFHRLTDIHHSHLTSTT